MPAPRRLALTASVALLAALGSAAPALAAPTRPATGTHPATAADPATLTHPAVQQLTALLGLPPLVHHLTVHGHQTKPRIPSSAPAHLVGPHGETPANQNYSANWAGYVANANSGTGPYKTVSANWTAPTATCTSQDTYSSFWVGLDGDGSDTVEQTGTSADCSGGSPVYYAWYEMYPAYPVQLPDHVQPGDQLSASVVTDGSGSFTLTISDSSQGWTESTSQQLSGAQLASAEVIAEAPSSNAGVLPLTDFGTVQFSGASVNGGSLTAANPEKVDMAANGVLKAATSDLSGGTDFSVAWKST
ncbi:hypothetical protein E6W39_37640 [Kitasatospora acidiphila]|uniref:Peptidase A4 family protein n=1 Tax=Kitasatospora acidiphila TaxID=2567942 RepID=A0A540WD51_9ACTN|nr:G1 family glutamic endopeptidase [Kitasatospora acidiphila]TQF06872.1 hypothetical protein E6W39_37640 [Kitasatospora acidiphila]